MNLARIKFFGLFICTLCKVQTVCFEKLVAAYDADALVDFKILEVSDDYTGIQKPVTIHGIRITGMAIRRED